MPANPRLLRVAVVGSGPSGIYTAEALTAQKDVPISVDVLERLPTPFGLVRYGVAPDHESIRSARGTLEKVFARPGVRFLGNVEVGQDLDLIDLHRHFDAVVFAYGAARDRRLGIPGEDLAGSVAATDFVAWYCGHPDAPREQIESSFAGARSAVVVGMGNVAVDVTRLLAKTAVEIEHTEMPQHVLDAFAASSVRDIYVLGRRGPVQASFTTKELRELGELADADVLVTPEDLVLDPLSDEIVRDNRLLARNVDVLRDWSGRASADRRRRIHLRFLTKPIEIVGNGRVQGVVVERTRIDEVGAATGTGQTSVIEADLVIRSVGYRGQPIEGLSYDPVRGVVPNDVGRVTKDGAVVAGEYVAGWIKRGPSGVIGTNKKDAAQTAASLLADAAVLPTAPEPHPEVFTALLSERSVQCVTWDGWRLIDAAEVSLGGSYGRRRTTLHDREALLENARKR